MKILKQLMLIGFGIIGLFNISYGASSFTYNISSVASDIEDRFNSVHFNIGGNNFWGGVFWLESKSLDTGKTINIFSTSKTCHTKLRGLYFNPTRGNYLLPLDTETLNFLSGSDSSYDNLTFSGGFYTACEDDVNSIYGQITYENDSSGRTTHLNVGTQYNTDNNSMSGGIAHSFQYYNGNYPVGYIYDDASGGIGFIGGQYNESKHKNRISNINTGNNINDEYHSSGVGNSISTSSTSTSTVTNSVISSLGNMGISKGSINESIRENYIKQAGQRGSNDTQRVSNIGKGVSSIGKVLNKVRKNTSVLCRGNWQDQGSAGGINWDNNVVCIDGSSSSNDLSINTNPYPGSGEPKVNKTIVVKESDLVLTGYSLSDYNYMDVFIDKGNLKISNNTHKRELNGNGIVVGDGITSGVNLQGNFIVNGLILGTDSNEFNHKLYIQGKVASLNTISSPSGERKTLVDNRVGSSYESYINLNNVFKWYCDVVSGQGSDGVNCGDVGDDYSETPFVVRPGNFDSNLF